MKIKTLLQLAFSTILITYLVCQVDIDKILSTISKAKIYYLALAFITFVVVLIYNVYKWLIILRYKNINLSYLQSLKYYWIGMFWNLILPGRVGGDLVKMHAFSKDADATQKSIGIMSVIVDRVTNVFGLFIIFFYSYFVFFGSDSRFFILLFSFISLTFLFFLAVHFRFLSRLSRMSYFKHKVSVQKLALIFDDFERYFGFNIKFSFFIFLGIFVQLFMVLNNYLVGLSLGIDLTFNDYLLILPVVAVITLIPATINGIGLRENMYVLTLGKLGASQEEAFSLSIIVFALWFISSMPGLYFYFSRNIKNIKRL